jgi:hypothetical protein
MKAELFLLPLGAIAPKVSFVSTPELATDYLELLILNLSLATHFITPVKMFNIEVRRPLGLALRSGVVPATDPPEFRIFEHIILYRSPIYLQSCVYETHYILCLFVCFWGSGGMAH